STRSPRPRRPTRPACGRLSTTRARAGRRSWPAPGTATAPAAAPPPPTGPAAPSPTPPSAPAPAVPTTTCPTAPSTSRSPPCLTSSPPTRSASAMRRPSLTTSAACAPPWKVARTRRSPAPTTDRPRSTAGALTRRAAPPRWADLPGLNTHRRPRRPPTTGPSPCARKITRPRQATMTPMPAYPARCPARNLNGRMCSHRAGQGTRHPGYGTCIWHKGGQRHVEEAWAMAHELATEHNITPHEALLNLVRTATSRAAWVDGVIAQQMRDHVDQSGDPLKPPKTLNQWLAQTRLERKLAAATAKQAVDAGVMVALERRLDLEGE